MPPTKLLQNNIRNLETWVSRFDGVSLVLPKIVHGENKSYFVITLENHIITDVLISN